MFKQIFLVACVLTASPAKANDLEHFTRERVKDVMLENGITGASVTVAVNGEISWTEGFGIADKDSGRAVTTSTAFSMASIAKPFTATAIVMLSERGLIDLDAPINDYLGDAKLKAFVGSADDATVRRVLNHSAGLPLHYQLFYSDQSLKRHGYDESIRRYGNIVTPPGEVWEYSNFGYGVLEYVIERISGKSYAAFLRKEIFEPLGMKDSFISTADPWPDNIAFGYTETGERVPFIDFDHRGGAALYASTQDLVRFGLFFLEALEGKSELLSAEAAQSMVSQGPSTGMHGSNYGLGWFLDKLGDRNIIQHSGSLPGAKSRLVISPEDKTVIAVAVNSNVSSREVYSPVVQLLTPQLRSPKDVEKQAELLKTMTGNWAGHIAVDNGKTVPIKLHINAGGEIEAWLQGTPLLVDEVGLSHHSGRPEILFHNGTIPTSDAQSYPHRLMLTLSPREDRLQGFATALGRRQIDRGGSGLSYWVDLERASSITSP